MSVIIVIFFINNWRKIAKLFTALTLLIFTRDFDKIIWDVP